MTDIPTTQRAWLQTTRGDPSSVLKLVEDHPVPKPTPSQVLVKVHSVALNPVGYKLMGYIPWPMAKFPSIPEFDFSGVIVNANGVHGWSDGDEILGKVPIGSHVSTGVGAMAEYIVIEPSDFTHKSPSLSFEESAGLVTVGLTAYNALITSSLIRKDQTIFINGGSSSVGSLAVQIAKKIIGAKVVTSCSEKNFEKVKGYGADEIIDYTTNPIWDTLSSNPSIESIYDCIGVPSLYSNSHKILPAGHRFVSISLEVPHGSSLLQSSKILGQIAFDGLAPKWIRSQGRKVDAKLEFVGSAFNTDSLDDLVRWSVEGVIKTPIDSIHQSDHEGVMAAYTKQMSGRASGKIIINM